MQVRPKTRQEEAYVILRADILGGRLTPGSKLPFAQLCSTYGVSVGVIREVLSRLVEQGLVQSAPQQGFFVTPISKADLVHLTEARREIETLTLKHSVAEGDLAWESQVLAAHHRLAGCATTAEGDPGRLSEEWVEAHAEFHRTLLEGCANPRLRAIANGLRDSAELYRRWSVSLGHGAKRDIAGEHRALMDAALARDIALATRLLDEHISHTTNVLLESGLADNS